MAGSEQQPVMVVVVPFPAQGHLGPILQFSHKLVSYNIPVHYVASPTHNRQVKSRAHTPSPNNLHFHDFPIPPFSSPPPDPNAPIKFPSHLLPAFQSYLHLRHPLSTLLRSLSPTANRLVVVHDPLLSSVVQDLSSIPNAESYAFHCSSALFSCLFRSLAMAKPLNLSSEAYQPINALPSLDGFFTSEFISLAADQEPFFKIKTGDLHNSSRLIEGPYIDSVEKEEAVKQWVIGPLIPEISMRSLVPISSTIQGQCLEWLNKQDDNSVIYISFGTTTTMVDEQIKEMAIGLEESKVKFIWVMRDADRGDVFTKEMNSNDHLPKGFEERTEGMGMVMREWMPQLEILGHPSIGGFMTHCGWNSCLESIAMGVPVAAWPMHSDQPTNALLLTKMLNIGLIVREWEQRDEIVRSETVRDVVRRLMALEEGDEMRNRAQKLGGDVGKSVVDGGSAHKELEDFIAHITR